MHKFIRSFLTEWRKLKLPFENESFIVAVSGGADSVSLLLALHELIETKKLKLHLVAAHYNHNLRGEESERDASFVEKLAEQLNIEFVLGKAENLHETKENLEEAARKGRYKFLFEVAERYSAFGVLTAHTVNDQAETFLLNLLRGSGTTGLGAIKAIRNLKENSGILLIRPFLQWAQRENTEDFVRIREMQCRVDAMNHDEKYARVRVRKTLIPLLSEFNPKIVQTLAQTATLLQEDEQELAAAAAASLSPVACDPLLKELKILSKSMLYRVLRRWLESKQGDLRQIDLKHIQAIERLIFSRKSGSLVQLPAGKIVVKKQGKLFFKKTKVEKS